MGAWSEHSSGLCDCTFLVCKFFLPISKKCPAYDFFLLLNESLKHIFSSVWELQYQMQRNRKAFHQLFLAVDVLHPKNVMTKHFEEMILDRCIRFVQVPPFALLLFYTLIPLLLNVLSAIPFWMVSFTAFSISATLRERRTSWQEQ